MKKSFKMLSLTIASGCMLVSGAALGYAEGTDSAQLKEAVPYNVTAQPISSEIGAEGVAQAGIQVTAKTVKEETAEYIADLEIPVVSGMKDKDYEKQLNASLEQSTLEAMEALKKEAAEAAADAKANGYEYRPYSLTIKFEVKAGGGSADQGIFSLALSSYFYTGGAHGMPVLEVINARNDAKAADITLGDLLGSDYKKLVDEHVKDEIAKNPDDYFADGFTGIDEGQLFYVEKGEVAVVFSPYEIAPYAAGFPEFRFSVVEAYGEASPQPTSLVVNGGTLAAEDAAVYPEKAGEALVPLRAVAQALGFEVKWNGENRSVELTKGAQWTILRIGQDEYVYNKMAPIALGAAPIISEDGRTFVPVSFFSKIVKAEVQIGKKDISIGVPEGKDETKPEAKAE